MYVFWHWLIKFINQGPIYTYITTVLMLIINYSNLTKAISVH